MKKYILILFFFSSCTTQKTFVVVGHFTRFDKDTVNLVHRVENRKHAVYPIGTIICIKKVD